MQNQSRASSHRRITQNWSRTRHIDTQSPVLLAEKYNIIIYHYTQRAKRTTIARFQYDTEYVHLREKRVQAQKINTCVVFLISRPDGRVIDYYLRLSDSPRYRTLLGIQKTTTVPLGWKISRKFAFRSFRSRINCMFDDFSMLTIYSPFVAVWYVLRAIGAAQPKDKLACNGLIEKQK